MTIYAVVYGNYRPSEIDTLWTTRALAEHRCTQLNEEGKTAMWSVETRTVYDVIEEHPFG